MLLIILFQSGHNDIVASNGIKASVKRPNIRTGFIENKGQIIDQNHKPNPSVIYLLNTPGMNVQLRKGGFSYDLYCPTSSPSLLGEGPGVGSPPSWGRGRGWGSSRHESRVTSHDSIINYHRIDITLEGANPDCQVIPSDPLMEYFNYFTANVPPEGIKNVRKYNRITYKDIYPDIDLEFFTTGEHGYEYNFVVHPGGNINDIRLTIAGPGLISLIRDTLKFGTRFGNVEELIPESYYMVNDSRVEVRARFTRINNEVYGFAVNKAVPENSLLIIDPTAIRLWGTYYGGSEVDIGFGCAVDKAGNVYLAGGAYSLTNIASSGSYQDTLAGIEDAFLAKFDAAGQRVWGTYIGGTEIDEAHSCAVDISGNIYISGETASPSGIASPGSHQTVYGGGSTDCFLEKFNQAGARLWGTYYGGAGNDGYGAIATDNNRNVFLTGSTTSDTGISTPGCYQLNRYNNHSGNAFLAKFDSNGVRQWGTYYGGEAVDGGYSCATDGLGNVYMAGTASSLNNIASPGAYQQQFGGGNFDAFLAKFTTGGKRIWATYYGGTGEDRGTGGCCSDSIGNVCMGGSTMSLNGIASPGCFQPVYGGGVFDAFIVKFDSSGQRQWGTYYGGTLFDAAFGCSFGWNDEVFMVGETESDNNISTPDGYQPVDDGFANGMLVKFNAAGQRQWGTYYGGYIVDYFNSGSYVTDDTIYAAGQALSPNNIASQGAWQDTIGGGAVDAYDAMLIKFLDCWPIDTAGPITGPISVCKPSTGLNYSIPSLLHAVNYIWTLPPGFTIITGAGTTSITVNVSNSGASGNIWVKGLNKCNDPGDSASLYVTVGHAPVPVISGPNNTCAGTGKVYTTAAGKTNYQWSISSGGVITSGGTTADNTITVTWNIVGTQHVYVNYKDTDGCEGVIPTDYNVTVTSSPAVNVTISASSNNVCSGTQVTFTAIPINGGGNPSYQWKVDGVDAGTNSSTYSYSPSNNDLVGCILTSSITGCIMNNPDTSNTITMTVNPLQPVSVNIASSQNPVCAGASVTFNATPTNGGTSPSYQWKVNGTGFGANSSTYTYTPVNGDIITCVLTSNATCPTGNPATSNAITMTVNPNLAVSVSISASSNPFCLGNSVTFTATPTNGGASPSYQWKVNGTGVGSNSSTYTYVPNNNDVVTCELNSSISCPISNPVTSNSITMTVNAGLPAGITISASSNPFCPGSLVTFTATPTNGGTNPAYQWKVNGVNAGTNSLTYSYHPNNGDSVRCVMTSNLNCVTGNPASSVDIIMSGTLAPTVTFTSCFDTITTVNAMPIKLKGGIPLGGTYSGPGVNSLTGIFTPSTAGTGTKTITYTYTNVSSCAASKTIHIIVQATPVFTCGNTLTDIRDSKTYQTVQIGTQCWMATNLNFGNILVSTQDQRDNCIWEKYCYNDNPANCTNLGALYQWDEMMQYDNTPADQGFCPPGWHIPTENDWNTLFANYINNGFAGNPLKYSGYSGFNALLSGENYFNKSWNYLGFATFFWSSTSHSPTQAWAHGMNEEDPSVSLYPASRTNAFSVRCIKD
jgi:uncharacterized protein (TIGR02145 family)